MRSSFHLLIKTYWKLVLIITFRDRHQFDPAFAHFHNWSCSRQTKRWIYEKTRCPKKKLPRRTVAAKLWKFEFLKRNEKRKKSEHLSNSVSPLQTSPTQKTKNKPSTTLQAVENGTLVRVLAAHMAANDRRQVRLVFSKGKWPKISRFSTNHFSAVSTNFWILSSRIGRTGCDLASKLANVRKFDEQHI